MDIRINWLKLKNFKGTREATYFFGGNNARIEGPNGSGKSTVMDAFTWLLFGKDRLDQTTEKFELKTIDPRTGLVIMNEDHFVEAELTVDGNRTVLKRCWQEDWVKPKGEAEAVMKGHKSLFFVDGVDMGTKRAYDAVIRQWIGEDVFKLITNPLYFIDGRFTAWEPRRKALLEFVKDAPERMKVRDEFADLVSEMEGRPLEHFRKMVADGKRAQKQSLAQVLSRIEGMKEILPDEVGMGDVAKARAGLEAKRDAALAEISQEIEGVDAELADMGEEARRRKEEYTAIYGQITRLQLKMESYIGEGKKVAQKESQGRLEAIAEAERGIAATKERIERDEELNRTQSESLERMRKERAEKAEELRALGVKYQEVKGRAFEYVPETVCPACGQELPAERVAEAGAKAREVFEDSIRKELNGIISTANVLKGLIVSLDKSIEGADLAIRGRQSGVEMDRTALKAAEMKLKIAKAERVEAPEAVEERLRKSKEYIQMSMDLLSLQAKANAVGVKSMDNSALVLKKNGLEAKKQEVLDEFAKECEPIVRSEVAMQERSRMLKQIADKEGEAKALADELARLERLEFRIQEYIKADIGSVEDAINGMFRFARWKMFDRTMDGGIVEMCEVTTPEGVPYQSMNDAAKVRCGMDVVRVFGERYDSFAPVFIDNAEGVLCSDFGTEAQVIRLCVVDRDGLEVINE